MSVNLTPNPNVQGPTGPTGPTGGTGPTGATGPIGPAGVDAINVQTGTLYTFALADQDSLITISNAGTQTIVIPQNSSVSFATGAAVNIVRAGTGPVQITQGTGTTIRSTGSTATGPLLRAQYSAATALYEGTNVWYVIGDIS
jgi:hypothetical protein